MISDFRDRRPDLAHRAIHQGQSVHDELWIRSGRLLQCRHDRSESSQVLEILSGQRNIPTL
jgi:hypothetical protein